MNYDTWKLNGIGHQLASKLCRFNELNMKQVAEMRMMSNHQDWVLEHDEMVRCFFGRKKAN